MKRFYALVLVLQLVIAGGIGAAASRAEEKQAELRDEYGPQFGYMDKVLGGEFSDSLVSELADVLAEPGSFFRASALTRYARLSKLSKEYRAKLLDEAEKCNLSQAEKKKLLKQFDNTVGEIARKARNRCIVIVGVTLLTAAGLGTVGFKQYGKYREEQARLKKNTQSTAAAAGAQNAQPTAGAAGVRNAQPNPAQTQGSVQLAPPLRHDPTPVEVVRAMRPVHGGGEPQPIPSVEDPESERGRLLHEITRWQQVFTNIPPDAAERIVKHALKNRTIADESNAGDRLTHNVTAGLLALSGNTGLGAQIITNMSTLNGAFRTLREAYAERVDKLILPEYRLHLAEFAEIVKTVEQQVAMIFEYLRIEKADPVCRYGQQSLSAAHCAEKTINERIKEVLESIEFVNNISNALGIRNYTLALDSNTDNLSVQFYDNLGNLIPHVLIQMTE